MIENVSQGRGMEAMGVAYATREIRTAFPELHVERVEELGKGEDNAAFLVNATHVFRFALNADATYMSGPEARVLADIAATLPVAVPHVEYIGTQQSGNSIIGYPYVPGERFGSEVYGAWNDEQQSAFIEQLASIVRAIHAYPLARAESLGMPRMTFEDFTNERWQMAERVLPEHLSPAEVAAFVSLRQRALDRSRADDVFLHGDLSYRNIRVDRTVGRVSGIIDWSDMKRGDPLYDFRRLYEHVGSAMTARLLKAAYPETDSVESMSAIRYYCLAQNAVRLHTRARDANRLAYTVDFLKRDLAAL